MRSLTAALVVLLAALTACSSNETQAPRAQQGEPRGLAEVQEAAEPEFVESQECRDGAGQVLDMLDLGGRAGDMTVLFQKLEAIEDLGSTPTALCSAAASVPVSAAVDALTCFKASTLLLETTLDCPPEGRALFVMGDHIAAAREALEATR